MCVNKREPRNTSSERSSAECAANGIQMGQLYISAPETEPSLILQPLYGSACANRASATSGCAFVQQPGGYASVRSGQTALRVCAQRCRIGGRRQGYKRVKLVQNWRKKTGVHCVMGGQLNPMQGTGRRVSMLSQSKTVRTGLNCIGKQTKSSQSAIISKQQAAGYCLSFCLSERRQTPWI
eukprot:6190143-Pleurochrysis_carterae.AAC.1